MSSQKNNHSQAPADAPAAAPNRAARRAQKSGKAQSHAVSPRKNDQLRESQVLGQPRTKGRRGNR